MTHDPMTLALIEAALAIATALYAMLLRRRHGAERMLNRNMSAIADNYGRSGLP